MALAAARDRPQLSLGDALELTILVARKDPGRHARVAARWLLQYLEEDPHATIDEAVLAASPVSAASLLSHSTIAKQFKWRARRAGVRLHGSSCWLASCFADAEPGVDGAASAT